VLRASIRAMSAPPPRSAVPQTVDENVPRLTPEAFLDRNVFARQQ
jgi:hypothetical protein